MQECWSPGVFHDSSFGIRSGRSRTSSCTSNEVAVLIHPDACDAQVGRRPANPIHSTRCRSGSKLPSVRPVKESRFSWRSCGTDEQRQRTYQVQHDSGGPDVEGDAVGRSGGRETEKRRGVAARPEPWILGRRSIGEVGVRVRLRDTMALIRLAASGERVQFEGRTFALPLPGGRGKALRLTVTPDPSLRIHLATLGSRMLDLTGELADGCFGTSFISDEQLLQRRVRRPGIRRCKPRSTSMPSSQSCGR